MKNIKNDHYVLRYVRKIVLIIFSVTIGLIIYTTWFKIYDYNPWHNDSYWLQEIEDFFVTYLFALEDVDKDAIVAWVVFVLSLIPGFVLVFGVRYLVLKLTKGKSLVTLVKTSKIFRIAVYITIGTCFVVGFWQYYAIYFWKQLVYSHFQHSPADLRLLKKHKYPYLFVLEKIKRGDVKTREQIHSLFVEYSTEWYGFRTKTLELYNEWLTYDTYIYKIGWWGSINPMKIIVVYVSKPGGEPESCYMHIYDPPFTYYVKDDQLRLR